MTKRYDDLTIDEVMADPMIRTVMRADRVEPQQFESLLRGLAAVPILARRNRLLPRIAVPTSTTLAKMSARCGAACGW